MTTWGLTAEQKEARRGYIGGSDAGAIVAGGEEWQTLWQAKTGRSKPVDLSNELRVMMGLFTEAGNKWWYEKQTGRLIERCQVLQRHPTIPYLAATLDGVTRTSGGALAAWQAKHVGRSGEQMELRYVAQGTHEALCCGCDWYVLSTFVGNSKWELTEYEVDPLFAAEYLEKCAGFWYCVAADIEPEEEAALPVPRPRRLRKIVLEDVNRDRWPNWGAEMVKHIVSFAATKPAADFHHLTREEIKALLPEDVGEVTRGLFAAKRTKVGVRMTLAKADDDE